MMKARVTSPATPFRKEKIGNIPIYIHNVPGDGNCMLHSVAKATSPTYQAHPERRKDIVMSIRKEMLQKLSEINHKTGKTNYESISGGYFAESSQWNKETSPRELKKLLNSTKSLGQEGKIILEYFIEKNILVVDSATSKLYTKDGFDRNRASIVLWYTLLGETEEGDQIGHFEPISVKDASGERSFLFDNSHVLIRHFFS